MRRVFADSFYFFAILNPKDDSHQRALQFATGYAGPIVTTAWVLTELADGLAATRRRDAFSQLVSRLQAEPANEIVPPDEDLMARGIELYDARADKQVVFDRLRFLCRHAGPADHRSVDRRSSL